MCNPTRCSFVASSNASRTVRTLCQSWCAGMCGGQQGARSRSRTEQQLHRHSLHKPSISCKAHSLARSSRFSWRRRYGIASNSTKSASASALRPDRRGLFMILRLVGTVNSRRAATARSDGFEIQPQTLNASHNEGSTVEFISQGRVSLWAAAGVNVGPIDADLLS